MHEFLSAPPTPPPDLALLFSGRGQVWLDSRVLVANLQNPQPPQQSLPTATRNPRLGRRIRISPSPHRTQSPIPVGEREGDGVGGGDAAPRAGGVPPGAGDEGEGGGVGGGPGGRDRGDAVPGDLARGERPPLGLRPQGLRHPRRAAAPHHRRLRPHRPPPHPQRHALRLRGPRPRARRPALHS